MIKYPKINTLFERDGRGAITDVLASSDFDNIKLWGVEEKIDGTNIRFTFDENEVEFGGRTDHAQLPAELCHYLKQTFTVDALKKAFDVQENQEKGDITLFGEGYGGNIQAGSYYQSNQRFILFDVKIGRFWLTRESIKTIADTLGIEMVPQIGFMTKEEIVEFVQSKPLSRCSTEPHIMEGIIARTDLFDRKGERVMFKLKARDYK